MSATPAIRKKAAESSKPLNVRRSLLRMVLVCFALQIAAMLLFHLYRFSTIDDHFRFGWEMGRIGRAIALGQGFSNPYGDTTGPTAWEPPIYPFIIGVVFKLFGIYTNASAIVLLTINSLLNALTCIPIFYVARKTMGKKVALWSAWTWALLPYGMYWALHWVWDTTLAPLLLSLIFLVTLELPDRKDWRGWALFGLLWGLAGLTNPSMLAFLPFSGLWAWRQRYKHGLHSLGGVVLASLLFGVCLAPWLVRNYVTFGKFIFVRNDFGYEFRLGNGPFGDGRLRDYLQPSENVMELETYRRLGELAYEKHCRQIAFDWVREHPGEFAIFSLKRFFYYWNGTPKATNSAAPVDFRTSLYLASSVLALWGLGRALRRKKHGASLFLLLVLSHPTVYYFVYANPRYRHPVEPELLILAVYLISEIGVPSVPALQSAA
jgi:4-amino-4-deoxy-L-arabinose transferase-like glycosyltransferase